MAGQDSERHRMRHPITSGSRSSAPNVLWRIFRLGSVIWITTLFALRHERWAMERSEAQPHIIHRPPEFRGVAAVCGPEPLVGCSAVELNGRPSENLSNIEHFRATLFAERAPPTRPHGGWRARECGGGRSPQRGAGEDSSKLRRALTRNGTACACDFGNSPNQVAQHVSVVCSPAGELRFA